MTDGPHAGQSPVARLLAELQALRSGLDGLTGALLATRDGLAVAHDLAVDEDPSRLAAMSSAVLGLSRTATAGAGAGEFRQAVLRGYSGYFVVYAVGESAVLAVTGTSFLNLETLRLRIRPLLALAEELAVDFPRFASDFITS